MSRAESDGFAAEMFGSVWTEWVPLLFPKRSDVWFERGNMRGFTRHEAIYELSLYDEGKRTVVYLGKTKNLRRRMISYAWRGSHLSPLLMAALGEEKRVDARWFLTSKSNCAERLVLHRFEYAWNIAR